METEQEKREESIEEGKEERREEPLRQPMSLPLIVTHGIFIHASVPNKKTLGVILSLSPPLTHSLSLIRACSHTVQKNKEACPLKQNKVNKILPQHFTYSSLRANTRLC